MSQQIRIQLSHLKEDSLLSWAAVRIEERDDGPSFEVNMDAATGYRGDLSMPVMQVLSSEIQAGMLMGLKQAKNRNWQISLVELGASKDGEDAILSVPSDGFAVAATLAVAHGSGAEDLEKDPHGALQWKLESIAIT